MRYVGGRYRFLMKRGTTMLFNPDTNVRLLSTVLEPGYANTLWFPDITTQTNYFTDKTVQFLDDEQYVKAEDNAIKVDGLPEQYYNVNYVMYQNHNVSNKWFYAFIVAVEWDSMSSTRLVLKQDVIQTWFFNVQFRMSFLERMHTDSDVVGNNIVPEPIGGAQLHYALTGTLSMGANKTYILATTDENGLPLSGEMIDNFTYSGVGIRETTSNNITTILKTYVKNGLADAVVAIYTLPTFVSNNYGFPLRPTDIDGYVPKNNKLLSGAFITNVISAMGQELEFNPEYIRTHIFNGHDEYTCYVKTDKMHGALIVGVLGYGLSETNPGLSIERYPTPMTMYLQFPKSSWSYNQYLNDFNLHSGSNSIYIKRSKQNIGLGTFNAGAEALSGASQAILGSVGKLTSPATLINPVSGLNGIIQSAINGTQSSVNGVVKAQQYASGIDEITQSLAEIEESLNAPAVGNVPQSNVYTMLGLMDIFVGHKTPNRQVAMRYDNFLTMFGYAIKNLALPSRHNRKAFTYLQAPDLEVEGNIPGDAIIEIKQAHKSGIRYWVYNKTYMDYGQDNGVL